MKLTRPCTGAHCMSCAHHDTQQRLTRQCLIVPGRRNQYDGQWEYYVTVRETAVHSQTHETTEEQRQSGKVTLAQLLSCPVVSETFQCAMPTKADKPLEFKPTEFADLDKAMARGTQPSEPVGQSVLEAATRSRSL